jgi:hypothetical protein
MGLNSQETIGHGGALAYSTNLDTTTTFTSFGSLYALTLNEITVKPIDITKLDSAQMNAQPGTPDFGQIEVEHPFSSAVSALITGWATNKMLVRFKATVDDASTDSAEAFLGFVLITNPWAA